MNQHNFLFVPFSTRFVYEFFFLWSCYSVLWYWPLIILRYLRCIKKARSWHIFFSPFIILLCIVVFNWRSILSHLLTKLVDRRGHWVEQLLYQKNGCWLIVQVHVHNKKAAHTYIAIIGFCNAEEPRMMMSIIYFF